MSNMNSGWGVHTPQQHTANRVDLIAEKIAFVVDMMNNNLISLDGVSKELVVISQSSTPPRPEQIRNMSVRVDNCQAQIRDALNKIQTLAKDIDKETDTIQSNGGW